MGTYQVRVEDFKDLFKDFLYKIEGEVSAECVAGAWNEIGRALDWADTLKAGTVDSTERDARSDDYIRCFNPENCMAQKERILELEKQIADKGTE